MRFLVDLLNPATHASSRMVANILYVAVNVKLQHECPRSRQTVFHRRACNISARNVAILIMSLLARQQNIGVSDVMIYSSSFITSRFNQAPAEMNI